MRTAMLIFWGAPALALGTEAAAQSITELVKSRVVGEQADGYLGIVIERPTPSLRAAVEAANTKRRSYYADHASRKGTSVEEIAAGAACRTLRLKLAPGDYYRLLDGRWRVGEANSPVLLPAQCATL